MKRLVWTVCLAIAVVPCGTSHAQGTEDMGTPYASSLYSSYSDSNDPMRYSYYPPMEYSSLYNESYPTAEPVVSMSVSDLMTGSHVFNPPLIDMYTAYPYDQTHPMNLSAFLSETPIPSVGEAAFALPEATNTPIFAYTPLEPDQVFAESSPPPVFTASCDIQLNQLSQTLAFNGQGMLVEKDRVYNVNFDSSFNWLGYSGSGFLSFQSPTLNGQLSVLADGQWGGTPNLNALFYCEAAPLPGIAGCMSYQVCRPADGSLTDLFRARCTIERQNFSGFASIEAHNLLPSCTADGHCTAWFGGWLGNDKPVSFSGMLEWTENQGIRSGGTVSYLSLENGIQGSVSGYFDPFRDVISIQGGFEIQTQRCSGGANVWYDGHNVFIGGGLRY